MIIHRGPYDNYVSFHVKIVRIRFQKINVKEIILKNNVSFSIVPLCRTIVIIVVEIKLKCICDKPNVF